MKCERCKRDEDAIAEEFGPAAQFDWRVVWCPDSKRPSTILCTLCWAELQVWLKPTPAKLQEVLEGQDGRVDFVRPMGVRDE